MGISCKIACFTVSWMFLGVFGLWDVWCVGILVSVCVCIRMNVSVIIDVDAYRVIAMIISCAKLCHLFSECKCPNRSFSFSLCRGGKQGSAIPIYKQICLPKPNLLTLIRRWNFFLETESGEIEISLWKSQKLVNFTPLQQAAAGTQSMCSRHARRRSRETNEINAFVLIFMSSRANERGSASASADLAEARDDFPACGVCFEFYDEEKNTPTVLSCGHTFW